jgi:hypothetical protein
LLAISWTSSFGLLAKLPGLVFPVEDMMRCWNWGDFGWILVKLGGTYRIELTLKHNN